MAEYSVHDGNTADGFSDSSSSDSSEEFISTPDDLNEFLELEEDITEVLPYRFEPYESDAEPESGDEGLPSGGGTNSDDQDSLGRLNNNDWCECGFCQPMEDSVQSICCKEIGKVRDTMGNTECITLHEGFEPVCLNRYTLQTAYFVYRQMYGHHGNQFPHERYRYTGYRQFVRWNWGYLGKDIRVPLPSCVVMKIRDTYPSEDYAGFEYPPLDN